MFYERISDGSWFIESNKILWNKIYKQDTNKVHHSNIIGKLEIAKFCTNLALYIIFSNHFHWSSCIYADLHLLLQYSFQERFNIFHQEILISQIFSSIIQCYIFFHQEMLLLNWLKVAFYAFSNFHDKIWPSLIPPKHHLVFWKL